jgi:autotransporter-associated beta strand protein
MANIILFEANDATGNLDTAVQTAANTPGVVVVSMSWGGGESSGESNQDSYFTTPAGHIGGSATLGGAGLAGGVTFLAAAGDGSAAQSSYPAASPNVVAVGGTALTVDGSNPNYTYGGESGWDSGGGISPYESQPAYQNGVVGTFSTTQRTCPDVSADADPSTGVPIYDSYNYGSSTPWLPGYEGGTSLSTPLWAGIIAVADEGRAIAGQGSLDGPSQTLPALYSIDAADFHDVTGGNNGFAAGLGYDLVTGLGSPVANKLVPDLASYPPSATVGNPATTVTLAVSSNAATYGQPVAFAATVDGTAAGMPAPTGTVTFMDGGTALGTATLLRGMAFFTAPSLAAGSDTITAVYGGSSTFTGSTSIPLAVIVAQAALTVTADSLSRPYGQALAIPATEFTANGLLNGDAVTSVTLVSAGASAAAAVGTYPIVPSAAVGSGLSNYNITYVAGTLTVAAPLTVTGVSQSVGSLTGAGTVTNSNVGTTSLLTAGGNNASQTFAGVLKNGAGVLALAKAGAGNWALSGADTFTGGATVSAGTLAVLSGGTLGSGSVTVSPGAVFDVSQLPGGFTLGSGTLTAGRPGSPAIDINGSLAVNNAVIGVISPTSSGTLTISGSLALSGGTLSYVPGDAVAVGGALTLAATDYVVPAAALRSGTATLFTFTGAAPKPADLVLSGVFAGNPRQAYSLATSGGTAVTLAVIGTPGNLKWTGGGTNVWYTGTNSTANWYNTTSGTSDDFYSGDNATFDCRLDTGLRSAVPWESAAGWHAPGGNSCRPGRPSNWPRPPRRETAGRGCPPGPPILPPRA